MNGMLCLGHEVVAEVRRMENLLNKSNWGALVFAAVFVVSVLVLLANGMGR